MIDAFIVAIWLGGAIMGYRRRVGFWKCVFWPGDLGEAMFLWVLKQEESRK